MIFSAGIFIGVVFMLLVMTWFFRNGMIQSVASPFGFDETVSKTEAAIKQAGWGIPGQINVNAMTAKKGIEIAPRVHIIELCKPEYAKAVLEDQSHFAAMMPCRIGIYEKDGRTYIAKLNTGMMSKFLGGVAKKMMGRVGAEEKEIVASVLATR